MVQIIIRLIKKGNIMTQETKTELFYNKKENRKIPHTEHLDLPSAKGMKIVRVEWVPVSILDGHATFTVNEDGTHSYSNVARARGINTNTVNQHAANIQLGNWKPYHNEPPTVTLKDDGTYSLVTGEHRLQAHSIAGMKYIFVCVVEFSDFENKTALFWQYAWQSNENGEEGSSNVEQVRRTFDDIVTTVCAMIMNKAIKFNTKVKTVDAESEKELTEALIALKQKKGTPKFKNLINTIVGETIGYSGVPKTFDTKEFQKTLIDTKDNKHVVQMMKSSNGVDTDYDPRFARRIFKALSSGTKNVTGIIHFSGMTNEKIKNSRVIKQSIIRNYVEWCRKVVALADAGRIEDVEVKFIGQLDGEKEFVTLNGKSA
jgi:hypothetical protein